MKNNTEGQQPNPADGASATDAAKPNGPDGANATDTGGQGDGGNASGDAGDQGKPKEGEGENGTGDGQKKTDEAPAETGAPEAYEEFQLPEGFTLEGDRKESALALFKELGLPQDKAQRAIDLYVKTAGDDKAALEAAAEQQRDAWAQQAKTELGASYDSEVALAKTAVQAMQSPALLEAFESQGWGNHPEMIKAFAFFGKMMRDSSVDGIGSAGGAPQKQKPWDAMYPDMK